MEVIANIIINGNDADTAQGVADDLGIDLPRQPDSPEAQVFGAILLTLDQQQALRFIEELAQREVRPAVGFEVRYTRSELLDSPLVFVDSVTTRPNAEVDEEARYRGTKGGCKRCGSLAELRGPLVLRGEPQPDSNCVTTSTGEWLVSPALADLLRGIKGVASHLAPVDRPGAWEGWKRLIVTSNLPPLHSSSTGFVFEGQCPVCRRDGFYSDTRKEPFMLRYGRSELRDLGPVNGTYELAGNSWREGRKIGSLARVMLVVEPDVARILLDETTGDVRFDAVELV